jgi:hypothetical protein
MNIFIDESGSFVSAPKEGMWNAVAAFALPEGARRGMEQAISSLKATCNLGLKAEIKLSKLDEFKYMEFLERLGRLNGTLFCIATDAGLNTPVILAVHQSQQVAKILEHIDKMVYEEGRQSVTFLANQIRQLSPQLYVQLFCQVELMFEVVSRAITYYAQHSPGTLREFRWRVDQKNTQRTNFEDVFEKLSPILLQAKSISQPLMMVRGFDYSYMKQYEFEPSTAPTYLQDVYGFEECETEPLNIQKLIRGNIQFVDSQEVLGIQAIDLIVSGIRRCLRGGFNDNERVAALLGRLMIQAQHNVPPLRLISFSTNRRLDLKTGNLVKIMRANVKPMFKQ